MPHDDLKDYIDDVIRYKDIDFELRHIRMVLVGLHRYHHFTPQEHQKRVKRYDQMFKALLTEKARQEALKKMGQYDGGYTENASPSKADDAGTSVGVGDILKEQVTGSG
jgi:hypothetical protein